MLPACFPSQSRCFCNCFLPDAANVSSESLQSQSHFNAGFPEPVTETVQIRPFQALVLHPGRHSSLTSDPTQIRRQSLPPVKAAVCAASGPRGFQGLRHRCWRWPSLPFLLVPVTSPRLWSYPDAHARLIFMFPQLDCELPEGRS